ncbi:MAG: hypothetical protein ACK559_26360, partial [bacterium]
GVFAFAVVEQRPGGHPVLLHPHLGPGLQPPQRAVVHQHQHVDPVGAVVPRVDRLAGGGGGDDEGGAGRGGRGGGHRRCAQVEHEPGLAFGGLHGEVRRPRRGQADHEPAHLRAAVQHGEG